MEILDLDGVRSLPFSSAVAFHALARYSFRMSRVTLTPKADFVLDTLSPAEKQEAVELFEAMKSGMLKRLNFQPVPGDETLLMKRMKDRMMLLCKAQGASGIEIVDIFRSPPAPAPDSARTPRSAPRARKKKR